MLLELSVMDNLATPVPQNTGADANDQLSALNVDVTSSASRPRKSFTLKLSRNFENPPPLAMAYLIPVTPSSPDIAMPPATPWILSDSSLIVLSSSAACSSVAK